MRKLSSAIFLFFCTMVLSACATGTPKVMLNALQLPPNVQVAILYAKADPEKQSDKQLSLKVFWHNVHGYLKKIHGQGVTEVYTETEPLDFQTPKTFSGNTVAVGIKIFILNDSERPMRYRIKKVVTSSDFYQKTEVVYDGIREANELVLEGPAIRNQQYTIKARIELLGTNAFVLDSVETDSLVYTINSSGKY